MISVRTSTGLKEVDALKVRTASGLKSIATASVRTGAGLKVVWSGANPMAATIPPTAFGAGAGTPTVAITSEAISVDVVGGLPPYTYAWSKVGAPDSDWLILYPTSATTQFRHNVVPEYDGVLASFICTVTDSRGSFVASGECEVAVNNLGGF